MADEQTKKPSIFQKVLAATDSFLNQQIEKGKADVQEQARKDDDFETDLFYRKSVAKDQTVMFGTQGYQEKPYRLTYEHLKQMSLRDSIISAIIQTRQNQVSGFSKLVQTPFDRGFKIKLKDEQKLLEEIKEELKKTGEFAPKASLKKPTGPVPEEGQVDELLDEAEAGEDKDTDSKIDAAVEKAFAKAFPQDADNEQESEGDDEEGANFESSPLPEQQGEDKPESADPNSDDLDDSDATDDDEAQKINWRLERKAREILNKKYADRRRKVEQFILNCGETKQRPFESKRWTFDSMLRAIIRDSLSYDQFGVEKIPNQANKMHHIVPVDGSTIRYASPELGKYKSFPMQSNYDILYPEKELAALNEKDALELDPKKLEADAYKWVQVVRGRIERAFTEQELVVGMRNPTSDIFNNGYPVCELELLVNLVSSHLNTEFYNQAYFSQGFSAKGILHIKAPLNRRKIETIRQQWQHMIKGSRNSFQTPIFAGMDEVNWIPLTQNHTDIEFQGWLQYLIKMICAIYQIDPQEIGIGMKEEGSKGSGLSGDNTQEKIDLSRDKGLYPLLRFLENFVNMNIIDDLDDEFFLEFVGLKDESMKEALERQEKEAKFKKTVNEIRAEDGLPPLPGMDDFIMDPTFLQWYTQFSEKGQALAQQNQQAQMTQGIMGGGGKPGGIQGGDVGGPASPGNLPEGAAEPHVSKNLESQGPDAVNASIEKDGQEETQKSVKVEYYRIG